MVDVSEEVLLMCKKWLVQWSEKWTAGVCYGRALSLDGRVISGENYTACHAWLRPPFAQGENFLVVNCHSKTRSKGICSAEAHEAIILWMASDDCVFSKYILNRDDRDSLLNGGLIVLCGPDGASHNEALWMFKILRYGVEAGQALDVWYELYKNGVDSYLALLVASYVRSLKGATFGFTGVHAHSSVFGNNWDGFNVEECDPADLLKFRNQPNKNAKATSEIFFRTKVNKHTLPFRKFCAPMKKSDGWGGIIEGEGADRQQFVDRVLEWQKSLQERTGVVERVVTAVKEKLPTKTTVYLEQDM